MQVVVTGRDPTGCVAGTGKDRRSADQAGEFPVGWNRRKPVADGSRPRHCAICKGEMKYMGGTHRPSARRVMEFIWDDIVLAVDACPESCEVRAPAEICWERAQAVKIEGE